MEDSAGVAPGPEPIVDGDWLTSEIPGKPVSVRLHLDLVMRLNMAVREGFKALPRRGLETGGLLVGGTRKTGGRLFIDVRDFEPVESEHATGPSYMLSDSDRRLLESRITARQSGGKDRTVVGFYRSHTRRNFAITMEDGALFSTYFRKPLDLFLLIKANEGGAPTCGLLLRESGKELSGSPCVQFPLEYAAYPAPAREIPRAIPPAVPSAAPAVAVSAAPALPAPADPPKPRATAPNALLTRWPVWLAIAAGAILAIGIPVGTRPAYPLRSLALKVADTGTNLRLSWDHQAAGISNRAVLFIKDGSDEHRFELDSRQLGQGSISYWPATRDVNFRLEWTSPSGKLSESVRAIGAPSSAAAAPALVAPPVATALPPAVPAPTVAAPLVAAPVTRAPAERPVEPAVGSKPERQAGAASRQNSRAFTAPASEPVSPPAVHAALPEPPVVFSAAAPPPDRGKDLLKSLTAAPDPALGGTTDTPYHVDAQALPRRGRSIPLIGRRVSRTDYVAPVPLHKSAIPNLPHTDSVREIDVKVYVNPSGKVDYAELVSKVSKADADLAALLLFSARRWEFVPAREGSDPTSGEVILHYRVGK